MIARRGALLACVLAVLALPASAGAGFVTTVSWAPDAATDGTGTGTLGAITVTYTTVPGVGNAGITVADNWDISLATNGAVGTGVTSQTAGVLGTETGSFVQTITFSAAVTDPILYVNFSDATTTMDFGALSLTLLDSNNAQLAGNIVSFAGSGNGFDDGFAARVNGTFGPGAPISLTYASAGSSSGFDSVAFTVGVEVTAVPGPSSLALLGAGAACLAGWRLRKKRAA